MTPLHLTSSPLSSGDPLRSLLLWALRRVGLWLLALLPLAVTPVQALAQQITVYSSGSVEQGSSRQLSAYVPLTNPAVSWSVNDVPGGNSAVGLVTPTGLYLAPATPPTNNVVTVKATSVADPAKWGSVALTITQPAVHLWSSSPASVPVGNFSLSLNGSNFGPQSVVYLNGVAASSQWVSATSLKVTGTAMAAQVGQSLPLKVVNTGLGGTTSETVTLAVTAAPAVAISISPTSASVTAGSTRQFSAQVLNSANTAVSWSVNGVSGGNATLGTVSSGGLYTAPAQVPSPASVTVTAASLASPGTSASASVTLTAPPPVITVSVSPASAQLKPLATQQFSATVGGTSTKTVSWSVNGMTGGNATVGTISSSGLYTAPGLVPNPATVTVRATSTASSSTGANASVAIAGQADPGTSKGTANLKAGRFLEQAAFGPTPAEIAKVNSLGISAWLDEQFAMPATAIPNPGGMDANAVQQAYVYRLASAPDQLRQRVIYALGQIIVISLNKNIYPDQIVPYLQLLSQHAFGNYRNLLGDISTSSQMGKFLDLANSNKAGSSGGANENYAREVMQLFSIGLQQLNTDGSVKLDAYGQPIATYDQTTIGAVAKALTGWTYIGPNNNNWENFAGPMVSHDVNHDTTAKSLPGCSLPAGQSTVQDMNATLDCLFTHPNTAPFISLRLIRALVTSNPSPAYVKRIVAVFNNNGSGVRGDLKAVVRAILTDSEARNDQAGGNFGRLKDPLFGVIAFLRAMGGSVSPTQGVGYLFGQMGQAPLAPPSVFGYYAALFKVPGMSLAGPEFQIYSPTEAVLRNNFYWNLLTNPGTDFTLDISGYVSAAASPVALIDKVDQTLLYGRMPQAMRQSLMTAIVAQPDNPSRAQAALLLTLASGDYAVHH